MSVGAERWSAATGLAGASTSKSYIVLDNVMYNRMSGTGTLCSL